MQRHLEEDAVITQSDRFSFIMLPYFLGTVGVVVGILLAFGTATGPIGYMAIFTGWICLCLGGTNALLARMLAKLEGGGPALDEEEESGNRDAC